MRKKGPQQTEGVPAFLRLKISRPLILEDMDIEEETQIALDSSTNSYIVIQSTGWFQVVKNEKTEYAINLFLGNEGEDDMLICKQNTDIKGKN